MATGFVFLKDSPYSDAEGSSQIRSCLHDAINNATPRIGKIKNKNCIYSVPLEVQRNQP